MERNWCFGLLYYVYFVTLSNNYTELCIYKIKGTCIPVWEAQNNITQEVNGMKKAMKTKISLER